MSDEHEHEDEFDQDDLPEVPIIVTKSNGGDLDDEAFLLGCSYGALEVLVEMELPMIVAVVDDRLLEQLDLLTMAGGYTCTDTPHEEYEGASNIIMVLADRSITSDTIPDWFTDTK